MELNENIAEYYDELYPVSDAQKAFYGELGGEFRAPAKFLRIGCGTGSFEYFLAGHGADVTGLETGGALIESANRKRRHQLMALRFFQMSALEMARFLGKGFYNVVSLLENQVIFTHDDTLMAKLFYDCRQLLTDGGKLVLGMSNFEKFRAEPVEKLPHRESIRARLHSRIFTDGAGRKTFQQCVETGSGKILPVTRDVPVLPLTRGQIASYAHRAGFSRLSFYSGFARDPFHAESDTLVAVIS